MTCIEDILEKFYLKTDKTYSLQYLFLDYMDVLGARSLDRRRKDTSNTYTMEGKSTNWNRVECKYFRNSGDWKMHFGEEFCLTLRKKGGDYFMIEAGVPGENQCIYEISEGKVICCDHERLKELVKNHPKLFALMC